MAKRFSTVLLVVLSFLLPSQLASTQNAPLTVVSTGPSGELRQIDDANEIRVIFSEPMVSLGRIPTNPTPSWIHITPAIAGAFRWSGTTILMFTPDPAAPLPFATRYSVTIDRAAASAAGRALAQPVEFAFTTPTVRLTSARWARQNGRVDDRVALALRFNQPVRVSDLLAHLVVRFQSHAWDPPAFPARERARLAAEDPAGLRQYDAKVAATRAVATSTAAVGVRAAADWDKKRFPPADVMVVLETTNAMPPGSWLQVTLDGRMPSLGGPELSGQALSTTVELDPAFFVEGPSCRVECAPAGYNPIRLTSQVRVDQFARAMTARDVSDPARETVVAKKTRAPSPGDARDLTSAPGIEDAGFDRQPALRTFLYRVDASLQADDGQTLGYPWMGFIETWHDRAFTSFGDGHGVWEKDGGPLLPFYARNYRTIEQWAMPIAPDGLMPRIRAIQKGRFEDRPKEPGTTRTLGGAPDAVLSHGLDLAKVLSPKGVGLAWAMIAPGQPIPRSKPADQNARSTIVQVTNLGITVKDSPQSTLVFVTRLDNGQPVPDAKVSFISLTNKVLWRGKTNKDGVAMAPTLPLRKPGYYYGDGDAPQQFAPETESGLTFIAVAEKDGDVAYVASDWQEGIEPWAFGMNYDLWQATDILRGSVFTDRGVYKPGEEVHFKAIVRADTPTGMRLLPKGALLDIRVRDNRNRELDKRSIPVNKWSGADWTWTVPAEGSTGSYSVTAWMRSAEPPPDAGGDTTVRRPPNGEWLKRIDGSFLVAAYRRPDFRVDTTLTAADAVSGRPLRAVVDGRYLFGSAMSKRSVRWSLERQPGFGVPAALRQNESWKNFGFGYYVDVPRPHDPKVAGETAALDPQGKLTLDLPTSHDVDYPYAYKFIGEVEDVSRQRIADAATLVLYPSSVFVGLKTDKYFVTTEKGADLEIVVVDHAGKAVAGVPVQVSMKRIQWNSVRRAEGSGFYTWESEKIETPAGEWTVQSGASPATLHIPIAEGGAYNVQATAKDSNGRPTRTDSSFYGLGKGYTAWERFDHNRITLKPEHNTWKPGENARVMIQSPWESATALLTIEREGIRSYRRFALTSTQQTVEVPITEADTPNVYVSVLLIRGRIANNIGADGTDPDKPQFRLGYVNLVVEDATKKLDVKVTADRSEYRPANVAKVSVAVRDAANQPAKSEVTLWAVDYGVLSLTGYALPDVLGQVYEPKALQVATIDNRQRLISRRVLTPKGANDGGGGGDEAGRNGVRKDFRPLAFWVGSIETDGSGRATADVKLPDSLTTYHILAVAGDARSRFGSATPTPILVNKPLTILPAFPRFLTLGDRAAFGAAVTNTLTAKGDAVVTMKSLDPATLDFEDGSRTVTLDGGTTEAVRFNATAKQTGTARVQMTAKLGDNTDAFETTLPITVISPIESQVASGEATPRSLEKIALPPGVLPQLGGLRIDLAPTALVGLGEGVRYLENYPYTCAEQKSSKAKVLLLAADLGSAFGMGRVTPSEYRAEAVALLKDLPNYQCPNGGFTLWPGNCFSTNAYLTAYVLHVMKIGESLGVAPDKRVTDAALDYLDAALKAPAPRQVQWLPLWGATNAFSVKVRTEYGRNQDANLTRLMTTIDQLPVVGWSYLADALASSNDRGPRYQDVVRRITNAFRIENDRAHVEAADRDALSWIWISNVSGTAIVLDGFVRRGDDQVFVERMVRWLLQARRNGRWDNTHENAQALLALVTYYRKYEAETPDLQATAAIGDKAIGVATFRGRTTVAQPLQMTISEVLAAAPTPADLTINKTGTGRLFYTARLQFASATPPPAADRGMRVERRYERFVENGDGPVATTYDAGDLVRVTLTLTLPQERRYVAVTDPLPAGFEPVEGWFRTTAADIARQAEGTRDPLTYEDWWLRGGFDRTEKYDNRVQLFATRLAEGRHEFSYLVRATTSGTFSAAGTWAEEMYAPAVNGRSSAVTIVIK